MDPTLLPTAFLINQISDILVKHEKVINRKEKHFKFEKFIDINANHVNNDKYSEEKGPTLIASATPHLADQESSHVYKKLQPLIHEFQKRNTADSTAAGDKEKKINVMAHYNVSVERTTLCTKDDHTFVVRDIGNEYKKGDEIRLRLWKYCSNNDNPCCGWADKVDATLVNSTGKAIRFINKKLSDGGWHLSCKANGDGIFKAIIKVNDKPVSMIELTVKSNNTEVDFA